MRLAGVWVLTFLAVSLSRGQERKLSGREIDKQLFDVLKDVHNRGADLYNAGSPADCYRLFQGSLQTARAALAHRPAEQKFIDDEMARVEKLPTIAARAFALHESIDTLRKRLRAAVAEDGGREVLAIPPREYRVEKKPEPKKVVPPKDGVIGIVLWKGQPVAGVEVTFVSRGALDIRIAEGTTDAEGRYVLRRVKPGTYTVLLARPGAMKPALPERYATATDSPLIVDVKGGGDRLDFLLQ